MYNQINNNFNQINIWGGDKLKSEFNYSFGFCQCPNPFRISNCIELQNIITNNSNVNYFLNNNIDCSGISNFI